MQLTEEPGAVFLSGLTYSGSHLTRSSLFSVGLRPFYLAGALFALAATLAWAAIMTGVGIGPYPALPTSDWHAHEMLFGFAPAIVAGFLLTAVREWTGRPTASAVGLLVLLAVWCAGRVSMASASLATAAFIDILFLPLLAVVLIIPIIASGNRRNAAVALVLIGLALCNLAFHLDRLGVWLLSDPTRPLRLGIDFVLLLMVIVGGRIIPFFVRRSGVADPSTHWVFDTFAVLAVAAMILWDAFASAQTVSISMAALCGAAALVHLLRLATWAPLRCKAEPLLWSLMLGYFWIPIGFALRAFSLAGLLPDAGWLHALTAGAMGGLMLAVMTRSSLGHTGRPLTGTSFDAFIYVFAAAGAAIRVSATIMPPLAVAGYIASALLWSAAFALFLIRYAPILVAPRIDRRAGGLR